MSHVSSRSIVSTISIVSQDNSRLMSILTCSPVLTDVLLFLRSEVCREIESGVKEKTEKTEKQERRAITTSRRMRLLHHTHETSIGRELDYRWTEIALTTISINRRSKRIAGGTGTRLDFQSRLCGGVPLYTSDRMTFRPGQYFKGHE